MKTTLDYQHSKSHKKKTYCIGITKTFKWLNYRNITYLKRYITSTKNLEEIFLDLSESKFNTTIAQIIPIFLALRSLSNTLKSLKIRICTIKTKSQINDQALSQLAFALKSLNGLRRFELYLEGMHHEITNQGFNTLTSTIANLPVMNSITLSFSGKNILISQYGIQKMSDHFRVNANLKKLVLDIGKLNSQLPHTIYDSLNSIIKANHQLNDIEFYIAESHTMISNDQIKIMIDEIIKLTTIKKINLAFCKCSTGLTDNGLIYFASGLKHIQKSLLSLALNFASCSKKYLTNVGWNGLVKNFSNLMNIKTLELIIKTPCFNQDSLTELAKSISIMNKLENLGISFKSNLLIEDNFINFFKVLSKTSTKFKKLSFDLESLTTQKFSDKILIAFSECIAKASAIKLTEIEFIMPQSSKCKVTDQGLKKLGSSLANKTLLEKFFFSIEEGESSITDDGLIALCHGMHGLTKLQALNLGIFNGKNQFTDKGMNELVKTIAKMRHIEELSLYLEGDEHFISDSSLIRLGYVLGKLYCLLEIVLYLRNNNNLISYHGLHAIVQGVAKGKWTESLKMHITGDEIENEYYKERIKILEKKCKEIKFSIVIEELE